MCPDTDDSGVPISCASCAASCPRVARRTFEALSSRVSLSKRLSCPSATFFSERSCVAFSISAPRRWLKARICASALESRSSIRLNPSDKRPTSSSVSTGMRRERSPFSTSRIAAASTSSGLPITRCVMSPETSVRPMTNTTAKTIEICSSVFSIDSTGPSVQRMSSVAFQGPCRSTSSSIGSSCASPTLVWWVKPSRWRTKGAKRVISGRSPRGATMRLEGVFASR